MLQAIYGYFYYNKYLLLNVFLNMAKFPSYKGATFGQSEVESYLEDIASNGWQVYVDDRPSSYVIVVDDEKQIKIWFLSNDREWIVQAFDQGDCKFIKRATSFQSFKKLIANAMQSLGQVLDSGPKTIRLYEQSPVSNQIGRASCRERV